MDIKAVLINNYVTPYREDLFFAIQSEKDLTAIYLARPEKKRKEMRWTDARPDSVRTIQLAEPTFVQRNSGRRLIIPFRIFRQLVYLHPQLIVCTFSRDAVLVQLAALAYARLFRAKIAFWVGDVPKTERSLCTTELIDRLRIWVARRSNGFIYYSQLSKQWLERHAPQVSTKTSWVGGQVRHPISPTAPKKISKRSNKSTFRILFVGGDTRRKGLRELITDLNQLPKKAGKSIEIICVGGNIRSREVEGCARVIRVGAFDASQMQLAYRSVDVAIVASLEEPWGFVFNEAILEGTPCVVSTLAGSSTVANKFGLSYTVGDPISLQEALRNAEALTPEDIGEISSELSVYRAAASFWQFANYLHKETGNIIRDY